jgi:hypothetical protein
MPTSSPELPALGFQFVTAQKVRVYPGPARKTAPYVSVEVRPVIDGRPLCTAYVLDALELVLAGARNTEADLLTCGCGTRECVGIFEDTLIAVTDETVEWQFPEDPFRKRLNAELFPKEGPLAIRFARKPYERALLELELTLCGMADPGGLPLVLEPDITPNLQQSITQLFARARERAGQCQS